MKKIFWTLLCAAMLAALLCGALAESDTLKLPADLTTIDEEAFFGDTSVDTVVLPDTVAEIRARAFAGSSLRAINLPDSLTFIDDTAFDGPDKVTVTVNKGSYAYEWAVENGYILDYPESAHPYAPNTDETWTYTWPEEADYLRVSFSMKCELADDDCLTLTDGNGDEHKYEYYNLSGLSLYVKGKSFSLRLESDESDEAYGFRIDSIQAMTAEEVTRQPFTTRTLEDGTLSVVGCVGEQTDIVIPAMINESRVTCIDGYAFSGDERLISVEIADGLETVGYGAFVCCPNLKTFVIHGDGLYLSGDVCNICEKLESVTVPGHMEWEDYAFSECDAVKCVTFTNVDESFNAYRLFSDLKSLERYEIETVNDYYCSVDGVLFNKTLTTLVRYPSGKTGAYTIPDTVTAIGDYAFNGCEELTSVNIPESVTSIGDYAFNGCSGLQNIVIPDGVEAIGSGTFGGCSRLESVTIPDGVTSVGSYAFSGCSSLTDITLPDGVTDIGTHGTFSGCSKLKKFVVPEGVEYLPYQCFYKCTALKEVSLPSSVNSSGGYVFWDCSSLESIVIPEGVERITSWVFHGCTSLRSVTIPESVTWIHSDNFSPIKDKLVIYGKAGSYAETFAAQNCILFEYLDSPVYAPVSDFNIENGVIKGYTGQGGTVYIPPTDANGNQITGIGDWCFYAKHNLVKLVIPEGVTTIGINVCIMCDSIRIVEIPESVTSIGGNSFILSNCKDLVLHVKAGSYAETYATENGIAFIAE